MPPALPGDSLLEELELAKATVNLHFKGASRSSSSTQGRTTVTRPASFIGFRELISARGNALFQLFCPVQGRTTVTRPASFIGFRQLDISAWERAVSALLSRVERLSRAQRRSSVFAS